MAVGVTSQLVEVDAMVITICDSQISTSIDFPHVWTMSCHARVFQPSARPKGLEPWHERSEHRKRLGDVQVA